MIRFLWEEILSQPASFWFSVVATAISIASFYLSQRNYKRAQGLATLEKRTKILYEIIDAQSKLIAAERKIGQINSEYKLLKSNSTFQKSKMDVSDIENDYLRMRQMFSGLAGTLDKLKAKLKEVNEDMKPSFIEKMMPEIRYIQSVLDQLSISLESHLNTPNQLREIFEGAAKEVQRIEKSREALEEDVRKLQEEIERYEETGKEPNTNT